MDVPHIHPNTPSSVRSVGFSVHKNTFSVLSVAHPEKHHLQAHSFDSLRGRAEDALFPLFPCPSVRPFGPFPEAFY
jgi:hypothetical protein